MTDDLEGFAQWRDEIETRVGTLEVTVETQRDHTARLTRLESGVQKLDGRVQGLEDGMRTVEAGVETIIGLLGREIDAGEQQGDS